MCGIFGVASRFDERVAKIILEGLKKLEYRGYDSVGIATVFKDRIYLKKGSGKIRELERKLQFENLPGKVGIGHTRWATHGVPNDINSHPHVDCRDSIAIVHNGILENYLELKKFLLEKGHFFRSDTDTEVFAHLLEEYIKEEDSFFDAFKHALKMIKGSYAFAIITTLEPDKIFFARKHSPLVIGVSDKAMFLSSDIPAFLDYTNRIIILNDGEYGFITPDYVYIESEKGIKIDTSSRITIVDWTAEMARKSGFPHFMIKEIYEQPRAVLETIGGFGPDYERGAEILSSAEKIYVTAAGTSFHASLYFALLSMRLSKRPVIPFISSEYYSYVDSADEDSVILAVSQSGETIDTLSAIRAFKEKGSRVIALTNVVGSVIARESDEAVYTKAGPEIGVAATKTFVTQLVALTWIAHLLAYFSGKLDKDELRNVKSKLELLPDLMNSVLSKYDIWSKRVGSWMAKKTSAYYLGRGLSLPIALEGALKLKEVAYVHAEGYPAGESKHGPIALVEPDFPVVFVSIERELETKILGNIEEMKARGGKIISIYPQNSIIKEKVDVGAEMPTSDELLLPVLSIVPLQLVAYYAAITRGYDPDKPRNLAKTVTVE